MKLERNRMVEVLFYTAVLTKQFYLLPSGSIGIADLFFALSGALALIMAWRSGKKIWYQEDFPWVVFLIFAAVINGIYFVRTGKGSFPLHTLYWIYSAFLIWAFRTLYSDSFMRGLCWICRINLVFQTIVLISGRGRYFHESWGGSRFMGTFNDPNQFAFFIFTMILVLFMEYRRKAEYTVKTRIACWVMFFWGVLLIGKAKSTGMFVGLLAFFVILAWQFFWERCTHSKYKKLWWFGGAAVVVMLALGVYRIWPGANFDVSQTDYTLLSRIQQKIWKLANGNLYDLLYDRSAERLVLTPQYLFYGAGEGFFERFIPYDGFEKLLSPGVFDVFHVNEIHSSFFDVWFSYGLIPTTFLVYWIVKNVIRCEKAQSAGTSGREFYADELQAAVFLVCYCDGGDVWEEGKKDMNLKHQKFVKKGCYSACISCKDMLHLT